MGKGGVDHALIAWEDMQCTVEMYSSTWHLAQRSVAKEVVRSLCVTCRMLTHSFSRARALCWHLTFDCSYRIVVHAVQGGACTVTSNGTVKQGHRLASHNRTVVQSTEQHRESEPGHALTTPPVAMIHSVYASNHSAAVIEVRRLCTSVQISEPSLGLAGLPAGVTKNNVKLIEGRGPSSNRIDVVLMGDGYTADEREDCFQVGIMF